MDTSIPPVEEVNGEIAACVSAAQPTTKAMGMEGCAALTCPALLACNGLALRSARRRAGPRIRAPPQGLGGGQHRGFVTISRPSGCTMSRPQYWSTTRRRRRLCDRGFLDRCAAVPSEIVRRGDGQRLGLVDSGGAPENGERRRIVWRRDCAAPGACSSARQDDRRHRMLR
jgi:hypothetical protein